MKAAAIIAFADFAAGADGAGGFAVKFSHAITAVGTLIGGILIKEISLSHVQETRLPGKLPQLEIEAQPVRFAAPLVMVIENIPALAHTAEAPNKAIPHGLLPLGQRAVQVSAFAGNVIQLENAAPGAEIAVAVVNWQGIKSRKPFGHALGLLQIASQIGRASCRER